MTIIWILLAVLIVFFGNLGIVLYNRLIGYKNETENMMGSIDAILKKRYDLIPNLVTTVVQYSVFERSLLEKLIQIRSHGIHPTMNTLQKSSLATSMSEIFKQISLTVENYPHLKANESFLHLQRTIAILEEELSAARRLYNQSATDYNNAREMFPSNIVAHLMSLRKIDVFKTTTEEQNMPSVSALYHS